VAAGDGVFGHGDDAVRMSKTVEDRKCNAECTTAQSKVDVIEKECNSPLQWQHYYRPSGSPLWIQRLDRAPYGSLSELLYSLPLSRILAESWCGLRKVEAPK
jgi:hypothetical protein